MAQEDVKRDFESVLSYWSEILGVASERNRLLILVALLGSELEKRDEKSSLTFSQLMKVTGLERNVLNYHLSILDKMGLITGRNREPYKISKEGYHILQSLGFTDQLILKFERTKIR